MCGVMSAATLNILCVFVVCAPIRKFLGEQENMRRRRCCTTALLGNQTGNQTEFLSRLADVDLSAFEAEFAAAHVASFINLAFEFHHARVCVLGCPDLGWREEQIHPTG